MYLYRKPVQINVSNLLRGIKENGFFPPFPDLVCIEANYHLLPMNSLLGTVQVTRCTVWPALLRVWFQRWMRLSPCPRGACGPEGETDRWWQECSVRWALWWEWVQCALLGSVGWSLSFHETSLEFWPRGAVMQLCQPWFAYAWLLDAVSFLQTDWIIWLEYLLMRQADLPKGTSSPLTLRPNAFHIGFSYSAYRVPISPTPPPAWILSGQSTKQRDCLGLTLVFQYFQFIPGLGRFAYRRFLVPCLGLTDLGN